jgi:hypothetical protein
LFEIEGMCTENVVVTRDRVTLRGTNPSTDGIQAVSNATDIDVALWVRSAHQVNIENLKLTGGFAGLMATEVSTPFLRVSDCRVEGNNRGVVLEASLLLAEDTIFTANIADSTIDALAPNPSMSGSEGIFNLTRVQIGGPMRFFQDSNALLSGVTQFRSEGPDIVDDNSFVKIQNASPTPGTPPSIPSSVWGFNLLNFSNALQPTILRASGSSTRTSTASPKATAMTSTPEYQPPSGCGMEPGYESTADCTRLPRVRGSQPRHCQRPDLAR